MNLTFGVYSGNLKVVIKYHRYPTAVVEQARALRLKQHSFAEISNILGVPPRTLTFWCRGLGIDNHQALRIGNEHRRNSIKGLDANIVPNPTQITSDLAKLYAALLYGCEGAKYPASNRVAFTNSDPFLMKTFLNLLRKGFNLDESRFSVQLQIHNSHNWKYVKRFWSDLLNIPMDKFIKPTITTPRGKMRRQNYQGTCSLRYGDIKIQLRLQGLFEKFCGL